MSEEVFDVVDENDEIIGRNTRSEVHRLGLFHRSVHVLVFNSAGQVFLQKRSKSKDREPELWDSSASGHVDCGEAYDDCAVREVREEIGLHVPEVPEKLFKIRASAATDFEHVWVYRCHSEGPFTLHPEEIDQGQWYELAEVSRLVTSEPERFAGGFRVIWSRLQQHQQPPARFQ